MLLDRYLKKKQKKKKKKKSCKTDAWTSLPLMQLPAILMDILSNLSAYCQCCHDIGSVYFRNKTCFLFFLFFFVLFLFCCFFSRNKGKNVIRLKISFQIYRFKHYFISYFYFTYIYNINCENRHDEQSGRQRTKVLNQLKD